MIASCCSYSMLAHHLTMYCWGSTTGSRSVVCYGGVGIIIATALLMLVELLMYLHLSTRCTTPLDTCGSDGITGMMVYCTSLSRLWCAVVIPYSPYPLNEHLITHRDAVHINPWHYGISWDPGISWYPLIPPDSWCDMLYPLVHQWYGMQRMRSMLHHYVS